MCVSHIHTLALARPLLQGLLASAYDRNRASPEARCIIECAKCTFVTQHRAGEPAPPDDDGSGGVLDAVATMLEPLAALLLMHELRFAQAEELLKAAFVQASARAHAAQGKVPSVSTLSVSTGLRRREIKRLVDAAAASREGGGGIGTAALRISPAAQARLRWTTDPRFLDARGRPLRLPRQANEGEAVVSFADLAAAISKDTHPRALLDELLRIGAVEETAEHVVLRHRWQTPGRDRVAKLEVGSTNVGDHLWAVMVNLLDDGSPPLLERAIFADGLEEASARRAVELSREVWSNALPRLREQLQALVDADSRVGDQRNDDPAAPKGWRMRIGMYSYLAPQERPAPPIHARVNRPKAAPSKPAKNPATATTRKRTRTKPGDTP